MDGSETCEPVKILTEIRAILAMWVLRALSKDLEPAFHSEPSIKFGKCPTSGSIQYILCDSLESLVFAISKIQKLLIEKSLYHDAVTKENAATEAAPTERSVITLPGDDETHPINLKIHTSSIVDSPSGNLSSDDGGEYKECGSSHVEHNKNAETGIVKKEKAEEKELSHLAPESAEKEERLSASDFLKFLDIHSKNHVCVSYSKNDSTVPEASKSSAIPVTIKSDKTEPILRRSNRKRSVNRRYSFGIRSSALVEEEDEEENEEEGDEDEEEAGDFPSRKNYEEAMPFKYFCEQCSFKTKRISHLKKHKAIHKKVTTLYRCNQCSFTSMRLGHLRRHESSHSSVLHKCDKCTYSTDDVKLLIRHGKQKHQSYKNSKDGRLLNCKECTYKTRRQHLFDRHKRIHCVRNHQCSQCPYRTWRKEHYNRHVNNVHKNKRPYLCHLCGKAFKRGDSLRHHQAIFHTTDPSSVSMFNCEVCGKPFRTQSHLDEHRAVHSNIRSFLCEICGSSFKTRSVQRKHIQTIHQNPRSKSCAQCDKKFNTVFALRRHLKVHNCKEASLSTGNGELPEPQQTVTISEDLVVDRPSTTELVQINTDDKVAAVPEQNKLSVLTLAPPSQTECDIIQETVLATEMIGTLHTPAVLQSTEVTSAVLFLTSTTII